jgi:hypothetical protein
MDIERKVSLSFILSRILCWPYLRRRRSLGSIAALTIILTYGFEPFVQNMVTYYPSLTNNTEVARIAIATNYTQHFSTLGVADYEPAMNEAIFSSAFGNNDDLNLPPFFCSSGNCVWPPYSTLAICARCLDLGDRVNRSCSRGICSATLPNGYGLGNTSFMYTNTTENFSKDSFQNLSTPFPISVIQLMKALNTTTITSNTTVIAAECALLPCVKTFRGSVGLFSGETQEDLAKDAVNNPNIRETLINTWDNLTTQGEQDTHYVTISPSSNPSLGIAKGQQFTISRDAFISLRSGITLRFLNGIIKWTNGHHQSSSDLADALYKMDNPNCQNHVDGGANNSLICGVQRVADAMTKVIRKDAWDFNSTLAATDMAPGVTSVPVTRIRISWGWFSLPVVLWVLSALVLIGTAWETKRSRTPLWKAEALPVLRLRLEPADSAASMEHAPHTFDDEEVEKSPRYAHLDLNRNIPVMIYRP